MALPPVTPGSLSGRTRSGGGSRDLSNVPTLAPVPSGYDAWLLDLVRANQRQIAQQKAAVQQGTIGDLFSQYEADQMRMAQLAADFAERQGERAAAGYSAEAGAINAQIAELQAHKSETIRELGALMERIRPNYEAASAATEAVRGQSRAAAEASLQATRETAAKSAQTAADKVQALAASMGESSPAMADALSSDLGELKQFVDAGYALTEDGLGSALDAASRLAQATVEAEGATKQGQIGMEREQRVRAYEEAIKQLVIRRNALGGAARAAREAAIEEANMQWARGMAVSEQAVADRMAARYFDSVGIPDRDRQALTDALSEAYYTGQTAAQYWQNLSNLRAMAEANKDGADTESMSWSEWVMGGNEYIFQTLSSNKEAFEVGFQIYPAAAEWTNRQLTDPNAGPMAGFMQAYRSALDLGYDDTTAYRMASDPTLVASWQGRPGAPTPTQPSISDIMAGFSFGRSSTPNDPLYLDYMWRTSERPR